MRKVLKLFNISDNKNVIALLIGTVGAQGLVLLSAPIISRLYLPEEFGDYALYFSTVMVISVIVTMRLEMAIILPRTDDEALPVLRTSLLSTLLISAFVIVLLLLISFLIPDSHFLKFVIEHPFFILLGCIAVGFFQSLTYWHNRLANFRRIATANITRAIMVILICIVLKKVNNYGLNGLIIADFMAQLISGAIIFSDKKLIRSLLADFKWHSVKATLSTYKQFPFYNLPAGLLEKLSGQLPSFFIGGGFGSAALGQYSQSQRLLAAPAGIVGKAIGDVFRQDAAKMYVHSGSCEKIFKQTLLKLTVIALPVYTLLFFISPWLFVFILGNNWKEAGMTAQILIPMLAIQFIVSPLSNMFIIARKQKVDLLFQILLVLGVFISFKKSIDEGLPLRECLIIFTIVYSIKYTFEFYYSYQFSKGKK